MFIAPTLSRMQVWRAIRIEQHIARLPSTKPTAHPLMPESPVRTPRGPLERSALDPLASKTLPPTPPSAFPPWTSTLPPELRGDLPWLAPVGMDGVRFNFCTRYCTALLHCARRSRRVSHLQTARHHLRHRRCAGLGFAPRRPRMKRNLQ